MSIDIYQTSYQLTKYLLACGHKQIGFIGNVDKTASIADRYFGYIKALREEKVSINPSWHINRNVEKSDDFSEFTMEHHPSAYICHCDAAAQWLYTALSLQGLKIPEDISVVSFDNTSICESLLPRLTSIGPDKDYYAKVAFETMAEALNSPIKTIQTRVVSKLIERASVHMKN